MSVTSIGSATWSGPLEGGSGQASLVSSGLGTFDINWKARSSGVDASTTPEELLGAAHAACYAMAMSHELGGKGFTAESIEATSNVTFVPGSGITGIELSVAATVPGLSADAFEQIANDVKTGCPVSAALASVPITMGSVTLR
jgi:osmotically inducible protein OsmC